MIINRDLRAQLGQRVQKYGRTTGLTRGIVTAIHITALVEYSEGVARFVEQFEVSGPPLGELFAEPGDSGALVVDNGNSPVGLLFARGRRSPTSGNRPSPHTS